MEVPPLSLALADLPAEAPVGSDLFRAQVGLARDASFRAVHLNAAAPGLRARELDRSARRDLASILRRHELSISGADLWIPPEHFADAARVDRAVSAVVGAIELVADLDRLRAGSMGRTVCITLPPGADAGLVSTIAARAVDCGARVANFGAALPDTLAPGVVGAGFDPAAFLLANDAPTAEGGVMKLPGNLVGARLTDAGPFGRVAPGTGRLDLLSYAMSLAASGYRGHVVLDARGLSDPLTAVRQAKGAWEGVGLLRP